MTPAGRGTIVAGLAIAIVGIVVGYPALLAMGVTLLLATALAVLVAGRDADLSVDRAVVPERLAAGNDAFSVLTITNPGRRPFGASVARERVGDLTASISLPNLEPGESITIRHPLPTDRRGIFDVGPLTVPRADPIGLARRGDVGSDVGQLTVHPLTHEIEPFPAKRRRDLEGAPSGEAAAGGITFANLREYVPGDDVRLVHWKSSARTDQLLIRHTIDVHRPRTCVVLDTTAALYPGDAFEDAVEAAASIAVAAIRRRFPYVLYTTSGDIVQDPTPMLAMLDFLAGLETTDEPTSTVGRTALDATRRNAGLSCAVITGRAGVETLQTLGPLRTRFEQLTIVRMGAGSGAEIHELSGATLINAATSDHFSQAWSRRMGG